MDKDDVLAWRCRFEPAPRWVGKDAPRELTSPKVRAQLDRAPKPRPAPKAALKPKSW